MGKKLEPTRYLRDVRQHCPVCLARPGERCELVQRPDVVHISRRIAALMSEQDRPNLLELVRALERAGQTRDEA